MTSSRSATSPTSRSRASCSRTSLRCSPTATAFGGSSHDIAGRYAGRVDVVVGIEARGFILGAAVAYELASGFVPGAQGGQAPRETTRGAYALEYGTAEIEVHTDAFEPGQRVLVIDDVLATGGTAAATCLLVERAGAEVAGVEVVLELGLPRGPRTSRGPPVNAVLTAVIPDGRPRLAS